MKSRIRGGDAARAAVAMAERRPVPLQATDVIGPHLPVTAFERHGKRPPRVRKPSSGHDVIYAPTSDTEAHRAELRAAFGETLSDQFVEEMVGKLISGLQIGPGDWAAPVQDARRGSRQRCSPRSEERQLQARPLHQGGGCHAPMATRGYSYAPRPEQAPWMTIETTESSDTRAIGTHRVRVAR
jgi:hypothetical protein